MPTRTTASNEEQPPSGPLRRFIHRTTPSRLARLLALACLAALAVVVANLISMHFGAASSTVDIGVFPDHFAVSGFHGRERDTFGTSYRWSRGDAALTLRGASTVEPATLRLRLGGLPKGAAVPRVLTLGVDGSPWLSLDTTDQERRYTLLLPSGALADGEVDLALHSATTAPPSDKRQLGVRIDTATITWPAGGWTLPPAPLVLAQLGLGLIWMVVAGQLGLRRAPAWAVALLLMSSLVLYAALDPGLASPWYGRLVGAGLVTAALVWGAARLLTYVAPEEPASFVQGLLLITVAALALRLAGVLYPTFFAHDLTINAGWLRLVQFGELVILDRPFEFGKRLTAISPAAYILALPVGLIDAGGVPLQAFYALIDGLTPLLAGLLARRLGLSRAAALVTACLMAVLPLHLTALYWGFVRQIVGQWLTLLLMVVLAGEAPRGRLAWSAAAVLIAVNLLIHPSTLLLAGVTMGLYLLAGLWPRLRDVAAGRVPPALALAGPDVAYWRGWATALMAGAAIAIVVQYAEHARLMLEAAGSNPIAGTAYPGQSTDTAGRLAQIWVGLNASYAPLPLLLVVCGLGALLWRTTGRARLLAGAWLASTALFLAVDIVTGQQVRYGYFSAPLVCAGVVALIEPALRRRGWRALGVALSIFVAAAGLALWLAAVFGGVKPSVNGLTH